MAGRPTLTDLLFYTMIGVYKTGYKIKIGKTKLQHGIGRGIIDAREKLTACHSSFFSSLVVDNHENLKNIFNAQFLNNLNSTVELPKFINEFDNKLETIRENILKILILVAEGKLTPVEGMKKFFLIIANKLDELEKTEKINKKDRDLELIILSLVREATLKHWDEVSQSIDEKYIHMIFNIFSSEQKISDERIQEIQQETLEVKSSLRR